MTKYLTAQQVLFIHGRLIETTGGSHGVRDIGLLASAVARPQATFEGHDLYRDLWSKTAALMESLTLNHPFVDGNKRTAITAAALFLQLNGWQLESSSDELERFTLHVTVERPPLGDIADWFRQHAIRSDITKPDSR